MTRKPPRDPPTEAGIKGPTSRAFARIGGVGLVACMHRGGDYGRARHTRLPLHTLLFQRASSNKSGDDSIYRSDLVEEIRDPSRRQRRDSIGPCWGEGRTNQGGQAGGRCVCLLCRLRLCCLRCGWWVVGGSRRLRSKNEGGKYPTPSRQGARPFRKQHRRSHGPIH